MIDGGLSTIKIDDYILSKLSNEAENFKEDVTLILNYGKYSAQVVQNTPPSWTARNGEFVFFASGATKRLYFYNINAWDFLEYSSGSAGGDQNGYVSSLTQFSAATTFPGLNITMGANETVSFELIVITSSSGTDPQNFKMVAPLSTVLVVTYEGSSAGTIQRERKELNDTFTGDFFPGASTGNFLKVYGILQTQDSSGLVTFQARQASITDFGAVLAGSYMKARKMF